MHSPPLPSTPVPSSPVPSSDDGTLLISAPPPKPYLQSLTVWGVLVYVLAWGLAAVGWDIGVTGADHLLTLVVELAQAGGLGAAIVGLRRATTPLAGIVRAPRDDGGAQ